MLDLSVVYLDFAWNTCEIKMLCKLSCIVENTIGS